MNDQHINRFLKCACGQNIPLPHPSLEEVIAIQTGASREIRTAVFVCTECGLVSGYTSEGVRTVVSPFPDPYQQGRCALFYIETQCDKTHCEAQKRLYLLGTGPNNIGEGAMKVQPKDWRFSPSSTCKSGHPLKLFLERPYTFFQESDSPL